MTLHQPLIQTDRQTQPLSPRALLLGAWSRTGAYDLSLFKEIESPSNREVAPRLLVLGATALLIGLVLSDPFFLIWFGVYCIALICFFRGVRALPDLVGYRTVLGLVLLTICMLLLTSGMAGYLWYRFETFGKVIAVLYLGGLMMNTMTIRSREPINILADSIGIALCVLYLIAQKLLVQGVTPENLLVTVTIALTYLYFLFVTKDVSRLRLQLEHARRTEVDRARLEAVGRLAGGVAHDFNNLLTVIIGNLQLRREIQRDGGSYTEMEYLVREAETAAARAARTTAQLLAYSRKAHLQPGRVPLEKAIVEIDAILRRPLPAPVRLHYDLASDMPEVITDLAQFENVLLNLVLNARDAMPGGGDITIRLRLASDRDVRAEVAEPLAGVDSHVCVEVVDTGDGMPEAVLARVTEPFFTTKRVGEGSGLGLSMAAGFARQSHGGLAIRSTPGQGTTVALYLPACTSADCPAMLRETPPAGEPGARRGALA